MRSPFTRGLSLLLLVVAAPAAAQDLDPKRARALIDRCLTGSEGERAQALAKIQRSAKKRPTSADLERWKKMGLAALARLPKANGASVKGADFELRYTELGRPTAGGSLLIYLHGGGTLAGINDQAWKTVATETKAYGYPYVVAPRCPDDQMAVGWYSDVAVKGLQRLIQDLVRTHELDPDRVVLGGYSMGSWGMSVLGPALGDQLAAGFAQAGGGTAEHLANLRNLPIVFHVGDQDTAARRLGLARDQKKRLEALKQPDPQGYPFRYKEFPGVGHRLPPSSSAEIGAFLKTQKRVVTPTRLVWRPLKPYLKGFYWLEHPSPPMLKQVVVQLGSKNRIAVTGATPGLTLYLRPDMLSHPKRPIALKINGGRPRRVKVRPSAAAVIGSISRFRDPRRVFTHRIVVGK